MNPDADRLRAELRVSADQFAVGIADDCIDVMARLDFESGAARKALQRYAALHLGFHNIPVNLATQVGVRAKQSGDGSGGRHNFIRALRGAC